MISSQLGGEEATLGWGGGDYYVALTSIHSYRIETIIIVDSYAPLYNVALSWGVPPPPPPPEFHSVHVATKLIYN